MKPNLIPRSLPTRRQSGFTLVELMVGVLVGLVATVVMFQVFAVSEGQKRTTTGAGDAQQSGLVSLFQIERDIRMAGNGLNLPVLMGCVTHGWNETAGAGFTLPFAPVTITNGSGGGPDSITVIYGNSDMLSTAERLRNPVTTASAPYVLNNTFGFAPGDVMVVGEPGKTCTMSQVSALPGLGEIQHIAAGYTDGAGQPQHTKYNGPPAAFPGYGAHIKTLNTGGRLFNLGNSPTMITYAVQNGSLVAMDATAPSNVVVIADGIVQMQAQYGYDGAPSDGRMTSPANVSVLNPAGADQWADSLPPAAGGVEWTRINSIRLAIVARSVTPEKPNSSGTCVASPVGPRWYARDPSSPYNIDVSTTGGPDWGCFRYRVFEVTIPLRNLTWYPSDNL